jgi:hypothetical protein
MVLFTSILFFDAGSRVDTSYIRVFFMLDIASKGNIVGMIRQMTTTF